jgi:hypothetical protein
LGAFGIFASARRRAIADARSREIGLPETAR